MLIHRSDAITVPAIERRPTPLNYSDAHSVDLVVGLEQCGLDMWVWIGPDDDVDRSLVLTPESARRLIRTMSMILPRISREDQ